MKQRLKEVVQTFTCINCSIQVTKRTCTAKYCGHLCQQQFQRNEKILNSKAKPRSFKKYLIGINGNKCNNCGITKWNNKPITMQLEHIDGNCDNNTLSNLELLCPNCHSQTNTYVGKNKGSGPISRKRLLDEKR